MTAPTRCGITSLGGGWACCRPALHPGDHCAHDPGELTGTPGVTVVSRSWLGTTFGRCDGAARPTGDRLAYSRRSGDLQTRLDLIPLDEGTPA